MELGPPRQNKSGLVDAALGAQGLGAAIVKCGYESTQGIGVHAVGAVDLLPRHRCDWNIEQCVLGNDDAITHRSYAGEVLWGGVHHGNQGCFHIRTGLVAAIKQDDAAMLCIVDVVAAW